MDFFLCFGKVASPDVAERNEGAELRARGGNLGRQVALIDAKTPAFRLNSPGWMHLKPELIAAMDTRAALRLLCRDRLKALVPSFAPRVQEFCTAYLDGVADRIGPPGDNNDVSNPGDRFFASLLPLPCPKLASAKAANGWIEADLGFWDGTVLTLARFGARNVVLPRQRAELDAVERAANGHLRLHWLPLDAEPKTVFEPFVAAAESADLPVFGPYRAAAFRAPLPVEAVEL